MSKTKGNVVDPLETIDAYGTDALRLSLVTGVTPRLDVPLSMDKVQANRNFANKLWNTARFLIMGMKDLPADQRQALAVTGPMAAEELASLALAQSAPSLRRRAPAPPALPRPTGYWGWPSGQVPPSGRQRLRGEGGWRSSMFWPESMTLAKESFGLDWWDDPFLQARSCQQLWAHVTELSANLNA